MKDMDKPQTEDGVKAKADDKKTKARKKAKTDKKDKEPVTEKTPKKQPGSSG